MGEKIGLFLERLLLVLYHVMIFGILGLLMFAGKIGYSEYHKRNFIFPNPILGLIGIAAFCLVLFLFYKLRNVKWNFLVISLILFVISTAAMLLSMYGVGWDAGTVVDDAYNMAIGNEISGDYYSTYPNNMLTFVIYANIFKAAVRFGITDKSAVCAIAVVFNCILFYLIGLMLYSILKKCIREKWLVAFGVFLYFVFVQMSPWVFVLYSDSTGILFPVLVLWLYLVIDTNNAVITGLKAVLILFTSICGYFVKATTIFVFMGIVAVEFINMLRSRKKLNSIVFILIAVLLFIPGYKICDRTKVVTFEKTSATQYNSELTLTFWHWLMIGLNKDSDGTFNFDDAELSAWISSSDERVSRNKSEIKSRISELGVKGLSELYVHKLLINYNDGTFENGVEGADSISEEYFEDNVFNGIARYFLRPDKPGFLIYMNIAQVIWLGILFFAFWINSKDKCGKILMISLMGITLFTMIFEAQQRYLFLYTPIYVLAACIGISNILGLSRHKQ